MVTDVYLRGHSSWRTGTAESDETACGSLGWRRARGLTVEERKAGDSHHEHEAGTNEDERCVAGVEPLLRMIVGHGGFEGIDLRRRRGELRLQQLQGQCHACVRPRVPFFL